MKRGALGGEHDIGGEHLDFSGTRKIHGFNGLETIGGKVKKRACVPLGVWYGSHMTTKCTVRVTNEMQTLDNGTTLPWCVVYAGQLGLCKEWYQNRHEAEARKTTLVGYGFIAEN